MSPHLAARDVDQVGDDRAGGRTFAGARTLEQEAAREVALGHHRIGRAVDMGQRMVARHQVRLNALEEPLSAVVHLGVGHPDQALMIAQRIGLAMSAAVRRVIPLVSTAPKSSFDPKAIAARIDSLCAASVPSTSKAGSASQIASSGFGEHFAKAPPGVLHGRE